MDNVLIRSPKYGDKKAKILMLLAAGFSKVEVARRVPCSNEWVDRVSAKAGILSTSFARPSFRKKRRLTTYLNLRLSPRLKMKIDRAVHLLATESDDMSSIVRNALEQWADRVVLDAGLLVTPASRAGQKRQALRIAAGGKR